jgi:hypothetical protein
MEALEHNSHETPPVSPGAASAPRHREANRRVRCRCLGCGAHVQAVAGVELYGQCSNCGSIDFVPLEPPDTQ